MQRPPSPTRRIALVAFGIEAPFLVLVPFALLHLLPAPLRESRWIVPSLVGVQALKAAGLAALLLEWLRPVQRWWDGRLPDTALQQTARAVYRLPVRFGLTWAVAWALYGPLSVGFAALMEGGGLAWAVAVRVALSGLALFCAALPLAAALLAWLVAPYSGHLSLELYARGEPQDHRSVGLAHRLLVFAVCAALAPTAWLAALALTTNIASGPLSLFAFVAVLWAPACAWFLAHSVGEPVRRIAALLAEITQGGPGAARVRVPVFFEDELGALAQAANRLADRLEDYDRELRAHVARVEHQHADARSALALRDEFLSLASHELRTPLTSVALSLEQLATSEATGRPHRIPLERARRQTQQLATLVRDLLDVSRIQAGRLEVRAETMNLCELVQQTVAGLSELPTAQPIHLEVEETPVRVLADPSRLEQVVVNLVENAFKYGGGKPVSVRVRRVEGRARLEVRDQGAGIGRDQRELIFDRFHRAPEVRLHIRGLGLGLYVCRKIVEQHGGRIWVDSTPGEGATFIVELAQAPEA